MSLRDEALAGPGSKDCELVICTVDELHPHSSYAQQEIKVPAPRLLVLDKLGDLAFREPLVITRSRTLLTDILGGNWLDDRRDGR